MLATFGLERLETALTRDCTSNADVDEFLQHAAPIEPRRPVRDSGPIPRRERAEPVGTLPTRLAETGLPTMVYSTQLPNPQFQQTRQTNGV